MRALVTGASGFIGTHLVRALVARGDRVACLVRPTSERAPLAALGVELVEGDVAAPASLVAPAARADVVFHLAALVTQPWHRDFLTINGEGARAVAAACAAAAAPPILVAVSSLAAAGPSPAGAVRREADPATPVSRYGTSKRRGELGASAHADRVPTTIVRPPMVVGEGDRVSRPLFAAAARGLCPVPPGDPPISVVHVADLVDGLIRAAERGERVATPAEEGRGCYFVAAPERPSLGEIARVIAIAAGRRGVRTVEVPAPAMRAAGAIGELAGRLRRRPTAIHRDKMREALAGSWTCSAAKAERELGFAPAAPLVERIAETTRWYRARGWI